MDEVVHDVPAPAAPRRGWRLAVEVVAWLVAAGMLIAFVSDLRSTKRTIEEGRIVVGTVADTRHPDRDIGYVIIDIPDVGREEVDMAGSEQSTDIGDDVHLRITNEVDAYPIPSDVSFGEYARESLVIFGVVEGLLVVIALVISRWRRHRRLRPALERGYDPATSVIPIRTWWWQRDGWIARTDGGIEVVLRQFWGRRPLVAPIGDVVVVDDEFTEPTLRTPETPLVRPERIATLTTRGAVGGPNLTLVFSPRPRMPNLLYPLAGSATGLRWAESRNPGILLDGLQVEVDAPRAAVETIRSWGVVATPDPFGFLAAHVGAIDDPDEARRVSRGLLRRATTLQRTGLLLFATAIGGRIMLAFDSVWPAVAVVTLGLGAWIVGLSAARRDPRGPDQGQGTAA